MTADEVTAKIDECTVDAVANGLEPDIAEEEASAAQDDLDTGEDPDRVWAQFTTGFYAPQR